MTVVVGGIYWEICAEPEFERLYGSGSRAAKVLHTEVEALVTVADEATLEEIGLILDDIPIRHSHRREPIEFSYATPLSSPQLSHHRLDVDIEMDDVEAEHAVVFGMVEARPKVSAVRAVVDPQHSLTLEMIDETVAAEELIIVANHREVLHLAGSTDVEQAVSTLFRRTPALGVVVKAGALGALVFQRDSEPTGISALVTPSVMPIGSGDVFSAALARHYFLGNGLVEAARAASARTADYVATGQLGPLGAAVGRKKVPAPTTMSIRHPPYVYVAASFATPEQRWSASTVAKGIGDIGGKSVYPLWDIGPKREASVTAQDDLNEMDGCDAVLLLADVARTGPFFEGGWATAHGIPIVVMSSDKDEDRYTMLRGTGAIVVNDLATAAYHSIWAALDHRNLPSQGARLMLLSGGLDSAAIAAVEKPDRALFVDYGQAAADAERVSAQEVAELLQIEFDEVTVDATQIGAGALINGDRLEVAPTPEWFPYRNQLLVTIAAAHALHNGLEVVILGTVAGDGHRHMDGSRKFIAKLDSVLRCQEGTLRLIAPHADTPTIELLARTEHRAKIVAATYSCDVATTSCGKCNSCLRRAEILSELAADR
ncbi:MAG: PfkB family carbohydrate kinase [bacterium]|nr:PfkB family carbohydrate kinase [bacterium]